MGNLVKIFMVLLLLVSLISLTSLVSASNNLTINSNIANGTTWLKGGTAIPFNFTVLIIGRNSSTNITNFTISNVNMTLNNTDPLINQSGWLCTAYNSTLVNCSGGPGNTNNSLAVNVTLNVTLPSSYEMNHTWIITAFDNFTSTNTTTWRTDVDAVASTVTLPVYTNATVKKNSVQLTLNVSVSDSGSSGSYCIFNINGTNEPIAVSGTGANGWCNTTTLNLTDLADGNAIITVSANDTVGNYALNNSYVVLIDSTAPTYSSNSTNSTYAGELVIHQLRWADATALVGYIFSLDKGNGTFVNNTWTSMIGLSNWSNVTNMSNSTVGTTMQWKVYVNDSAGNWNVSGTYSYTTVTPYMIVVSLDSPDDVEYYSSGNVTFNCSATNRYGLTNITLYGTWSNGTSGIWHANQTTNISGTTNSTSLSKVLETNEIYTWNCYSCDALDNCNFSSSNRTIIVDDEAPSVTLTEPENSAVFEKGTTEITFKWNVIDNMDSSISCSIYTNNTYQTVKTCTNATDCNQTISGFSAGTYSWQVNCSDGINPGISVSNSFTINLRERGGGGSGGGTTENQSQENQIVNISLENTTWDSTEKPGKFGKGEVKNFLFWGESHSIKVIDFGPNYVTIEIRSNPISLTVTAGETKDVDINSDGTNDLAVTYNGLVDGKADISIAQFVAQPKEVTCAEGYQKIGNECVKQEVQKKIVLPTWALIAIIVIVGALLVYIMVIVKKKTKD